MKKLIIAFFAIFISMNSFAQLEVKPGSFKEVTGFVNINQKQYDSNDNLYAVLKIRTENINDKERNEMVFKVYDNTEYEVENKVGEVWLYVSYFANHITISHPEMGSTEFYLPFDMQGKKGYELTVVNKTEAATGQGSLWLYTLPENGATITINGKTLKVKTPYKNDMMAAGHYEITFSKERFQTVTITADVYDGQNTHLDIDMPYMYGEMNINSEPSGATVFIDNNERGTTPLTINDIIVTEKHELRIEKKGCSEFKSEFILEADKPLNVCANITKCPKSALPGVYSVSMKKKVYFAKTNLLTKFHMTELIFARNQLDNNWSFYQDKMDWNVWKKASIADAGTSRWDALSKEEWEYVLFTRNTKSGIRYVFAKVDGANGIILLPDNWDVDTYIFSTDAGFESNVISLTEWTNTIEACGAVFLKSGTYWTSSGKRWDDATMEIAVLLVNEKAVVVKTELIVKSFSFAYESHVRLACPAK